MITSNDCFQWNKKSRNKLITGETYVRLNIKTKQKKANHSLKRNSINHKMRIYHQNNDIKDKDKIAIHNQKPKQGTNPLLMKSLPIDKLKSNTLMLCNNAHHSSRLNLNSKHQLLASEANIYSQIKKGDESFALYEKPNKPLFIEDYNAKLPSLNARKISKGCSTISSDKKRHQKLLSYSHNSHRGRYCIGRYNNDTVELDQSTIIMKKSKPIISLSIEKGIKPKLNISDGNLNTSLMNVSQTKHQKYQSVARPLTRTMYFKKSKEVSDSKGKKTNFNRSTIKEHIKGPTTSLCPFSPPKLNFSMNTSTVVNREKNSITARPVIQVCKKKKSQSIYDNAIEKEALALEANDNNLCLDQPLSSRLSNSTDITSKDNLLPEPTNSNSKQPSLITKTILKVGSISKAGFSNIGISKVNQDNFSINQSKEGLSCFFICDGHGANGHRVSDYVIETLPPILIKDIADKASSSLASQSSLIYKAIENSIILTNSKLSNIIEIDTNFSGTTCNSVILHSNIIYCGNVGDSRAILGKLTSKGKWKYEPLSRDHKATEMDEAKRIKRFGGRIEPYKDGKGPFVGPMRVWLKTKQIPGLAMTRSIGDQIASTVGVICEPEIKSVLLRDEDKFILMASDGLWEYVNNSDCVEIVSKFYKAKDVNGAVDKLYKEAHKKWKEVSLISLNAVE